MRQHAPTGVAPYVPCSSIWVMVINPLIGIYCICMRIYVIYVCVCAHKNAPLQINYNPTVGWMTISHRHTKNHVFFFLWTMAHIMMGRVNTWLILDALLYSTWKRDIPLWCGCLNMGHPEFPQMISDDHHLSCLATFGLYPMFLQMLICFYVYPYIYIPYSILYILYSISIYIIYICIIII
jgi:hypothetical protein